MILFNEIAAIAGFIASILTIVEFFIYMYDRRNKK